MTGYHLRPAAQLYGHLEMGHRSLFTALAFLFQGETCNILASMSRERGVGLKLFSKLLKNYCLLLLQLLAGNPPLFVREIGNYLLPEETI